MSENINNVDENKDIVDKNIEELSEAIKRVRDDYYTLNTASSNKITDSDILNELEELKASVTVEDVDKNKYNIDDMDITFIRNVTYHNNRDSVYINLETTKIYDIYNNNKVNMNKRLVMLLDGDLRNSAKKDTGEISKEDNTKKDTRKILMGEKSITNYLWIYEPVPIKVSTNESGTIYNGIMNGKNFEFFKNSIKNKKGMPIYRFKSNNGDGYTVLVKIIDDKGNLDLTHLKDYLLSTNSRMYKDVRYIYNVTLSSSDDSKTSDTKARNILVCGAPGTGKSHWVNKEIEEQIFDMYGNEVPGDPTKKELPNDLDSLKKKHVNRVTFYEDYSYENFIGCYKPVKTENENGEKGITYEFRPGPFTDIYVKATNDPKKKYFLVIEEINRARAASVFGDMFQLLDRNGSGESVYEIVPDTELGKYLAENITGFDGTMKCPENMYIYATMNSADQGVYPLDSAFKRRWSFIYKDINTPRGHSDKDFSKGWVYVKSAGGNGYVTWDDLRKAINEKIIDYGIEEDKCLGPRFFSDTELKQIEEYLRSLRSAPEKIADIPNPMADKLYSYLRLDVFRMNPTIIFKIDKIENPSMSRLRASVYNDNIEDVLNIEMPAVERDIQPAEPSENASAESQE